MKNPQVWTQSKFELRGGNLRASRNLAEVGAGSRLIAELIAGFYSAAIPKYVNGALLDLGCGKAPMYGLYSRYAENVTCVDWANSRHLNPHLDLIQDLNDPLRLGSETFQTVLLSDVLEHIPKPSELLAEISRVLVSGGTLIMNVPFMYGIHEQPHDYYRYTRYALTHLLTAAGFDVVELTSIGGYPEVIANLLAKMCAKVPFIGAYLSLGVQGAIAWVIGRGVGKAFSLRTRESFPLGYSAVARKR